MGERVFVTGATGRIGLPLVRALRAAGHEVAGLTRTDAGAEALTALGAQVVRGNMDDAEALRRGAEGAEVVYHLAGGVRGPGRITPDLLNRRGTELVIAACAGVPTLRAFVYASSCAVYGDRSNLWVEEDFEPSPNTRYGRSKADAEALVRASTARGELPGIIARIAAVYGSGFPFMMEEPIRLGRALLPGEGRNHVPTIHIDDCVAALQTIAARGRHGEVYHVADRAQPQLKDLYALVAAATGGRAPTFWSTYIPSYVQFGVARQNERLWSRLGVKPRLTPDNIRHYTNSVRLRTERLAKELGFGWKYPDPKEGVPAVFTSNA